MEGSIAYIESRVRDVAAAGAEGFCHLRLEAPGWEWTPGQFAMLRPSAWLYDPLLPRPFSIADQDKEHLSFFLQVVGKGTSQLSQLKPGNRVRLWGPLGRGFAIDPEVPSLLLAGGMGIAPFIGLIRNHPRPENLELIFGHRSPLEAYPFAELGGRILAWNIRDRSDEDLATLQRGVRVKIQGYAQDGRIFACGPHPFLRMVSNLAREIGAWTQLCLETHMACGHGACLGCSVPVPGGGFVQACRSGPVFNAEEIEL
jgi:dihydroorotate dehydrogenase electron transfer subunit